MGELIELSERSRSSARHLIDVRLFRACDGTEAAKPRQKMFCEQRRSVSTSLGSKHESLILAQNERWRQA